MSLIARVIEELEGGLILSVAWEAKVEEEEGRVRDTGRRKVSVEYQRHAEGGVEGGDGVDRQPDVERGRPGAAAGV